MTTAWFHCFAGIAGDMAMGALVDAGADIGEVTALLGRLARAVDGLREALAEGPVVVDSGEPQVGEGQAAEAVHGLVGVQRA